MRCGWCNEKNERYVRYHDEEWGVPCFEDRYLFEMLILEGFQAGLSWETVLNKRDAFRKAFEEFDPEAVAAFTPEKIDALMQNAAIIRCRRKLVAAVGNAAVFLKITEEYGSFSEYLHTFTHGETVYEHDKTTSPLSDSLSRDLKRRGMSFVGSTIIYSYLQAIGVIHSHEPTCFLHKGGDNA